VSTLGDGANRSRAWSLAIWFAAFAGVGLTLLVGAGVAVGSSSQSGQPLLDALAFSTVIFWTWLPTTSIAPAIGGACAVLLAGPARALAFGTRRGIYVAVFAVSCAAATSICFFLLSPFVLPGIVATILAVCLGAGVGWALATSTFTRSDRGAGRGVGER
jgi:hypothetical protein